MPGVYKHVERIADNKVIPTIKLSDDPAKLTLPGRKQLHRLYDADGTYVKDVISLWDENSQKPKSLPGRYTSQPLLTRIVHQGELVYSFPDLKEVQSFAKSELSNLAEPYRRLTGAEKYPVALSTGLNNLLKQLTQSRSNECQT